MSNLLAPPSGADGRPLALVTISVLETIGLANYSNVKLEGTVSRWVEDTDESVSAGLTTCAKLVEEILGTERTDVINMTKGK